jgi:His-Xaa-Ser system radical SAM maturase HxsC
MIDLRLKVEPFPAVEPLVLRLRYDAASCEDDAVLVDRDAGRCEFDYNGFSLVVHVPDNMDLDGDVIMVLPGQGSAHRLVRATSPHNTFLVTEQCDQLCVMCSQPPKKHHADLFPQFLKAVELAPDRAYIGLSGGEPMLHREKMFAFLEAAAVARPDVRFHILTNGQHFEEADEERLIGIGVERVLWGIPLYARSPELHDQIVGKPGAFERLQRSLSNLMLAGASVELRTVVMRQNFAELPALSNYICNRLPFISVWALMQMERIGYGRMNWASSFMDTSSDFSALRSAINTVCARGIEAALYNFPLCSVPQPYRHLAPSTISDWKRKYLGSCEGCGSREACGGFFEWYKHDEGFRGISPL